VFAFLPLVMMKDDTGEYIRSMPLIVIFTMMMSLLLALTLTPFLSSRFLPLQKKEKTGHFQRLMDNWIENKFGRFLDKALQHPKRVLLIAGAIFVFSLCLTPFLGVSYFPKAEKPQFMINISLPQGSSLDKTDRVTRDVEKILEEIKTIRTYASNIGRGNPQIHFSIQSPEYDLSFAQIFVELKENDLHMMANLLGDLRRRFKDYSGAKIEVKEIELGPPVQAPIEIKLLGEKMQTLTDLASQSEKIFISVPGTMNVKNPQSEPATDLAIHVNREKAGMLGITMADINSTIRASVAGMAISRFRSDEGKEYDITVRLPVEHVFSLADFDRIMVPSLSGAAVPLKQVAIIEFAASAKEISHYNFERSVTISADVLPEYNVERVTKTIISKVEKLNWPVGYHFHVAGEQESREESFSGMGQASLIALLAIFALLVLQFKSLTQPFIVFSAIPLAVVGSILALLLFGYTFSFVAFVGLTTLFGIVIKCSIILVDYSNHLVKDEGMNVHEAVVESAKTRFVPIFLTTTTTVLGLIPLALQGGTLFAPMSLVMIGGLITSSVLSLVVVPALYKIFTRETS
jgi:multidrug efflux pump subunit AcrB